MKKFSIILNVVLILVVIFLVVFAQIQTKFAAENAGTAQELKTDINALQELAENEARNAREAEANARLAQARAEELRLELQECKSGK